MNARVIIRQGNSFLSFAIRFFQWIYMLLTRRKGVTVNHSDIYFPEEDLVFGALAGGVEMLSLQESLRKECKVWVYDLPEEVDRVILWHYCVITMGIGYQYLNFLLHIIDTVYRFFKKYRDTGHWIERARNAKTRVYCIEHSARGINYAAQKVLIPGAHRINPTQFKEWCDKNCILIFNGSSETFLGTKAAYNQ